MHDFFIDRIVKIKNFDSLVSGINEKAQVGGGSLREVEQREIKGGNAVNVAYSLARLGARTSLITVADDLGTSILKRTFAPFKNVKIFISHGKQGYTISLEIERNRKANVMISDVGAMKNFGPNKLRRDELRTIRNASAVVMTNWDSNLNGTELALKAFKNASKNALCFLDPADISDRQQEFRHCLEVLSDYMDVLSINENECRLTMRSLGLSPIPVNYTKIDVVTAAKTLASRLSIHVDVHTPIGAATSDGAETFFAESFNVNVAISTGAGDIWDAADVIGYLCKMEGKERLLFANACAAFYISNIESPTVKEALKLAKIY